MSDIEISIILRTKNEGRYVGEVIERILGQRCKNFEIIAVDSGSTDDTVMILEKYNVKTIHIKPDEFTFGRALNIGAKHASGKHLVILSAHAIPANEDWLDNLTKGFSDNNIAGIYGRQLPLPNCNPLMKKDLLLGYREKRKIQRKDAMFSNANSVVRKDIWLEIPFDEELTGSEDYYWAKCAQKRGFAILYEPEATVYHSHNETISQIYKRAKREAIAIRRIDPSSKFVFTFYKFITRSIGVSVLDVFWLIKNRVNIKWVFYVPLYRTALFWGRYAGSK